MAQKEDLKSENAKKPDGGFRSVALQYSQDPRAQHIILPENPETGEKMTISAAIHWLQKIQKDHERVIDFSFSFEGRYFLDSIYAVYRAMVELYGMVYVEDFGKGFWKSPPKMVSIEIDSGVFKTIPVGPLEISGISVPIEPDMKIDGGGYPILVMKANIKNHERDTVQAIMEKALEILKTSSIYKGKAIEVDLTPIDPRSPRFDWTRGPKFVTTEIDASQVILNDDVMKRVETSLWTPIVHSDRCRKHKIPLKRGILLAGPYGTGKTLIAKATAKKCVENGWTYVYIKDLNHLVPALKFAAQYAPCVVFAEDMDQVTSGGRDEDLNVILNNLDGIDTKGKEVITVFTTNNLKDIHPSVLRPGRIDDPIIFARPNKNSVEKLLRMYGRDLIPKSEDISMISELLQGNIAAIVAECVERAKLSAIRDTKDGEPLQVRSSHLEIAAHQVLEQSVLLRDKPPERSSAEVIATIIGKYLCEATRKFYVEDLPDSGNGRVNDMLDTVLADAKDEGVILKD